MENIHPRKLAGYSLIFGPILALICFFIQPGGILQIGGSADPLDFTAQMKIASDNATLGIITGILTPIGLIILLSGIIYYIQSMEGSNGNALSRLSMPFFVLSIAGWSVAFGIGIGYASEIITNSDIGGISFGINIICSIFFGFGGILLAIAASTREEVNKNISYLAALAATVVFVSNFILAFTPESGTTFQAIAGLCFIIYTLWSILVGRSLIK
tara:strand:- start:3 stop:647 length:645 start_codon:yes stop_codon:yes gene_type:complete